MNILHSLSPHLPIPCFVQVRQCHKKTSLQPPAFENPNSTLGVRFVEYLSEHGNPAPYTEDDLGGTDSPGLFELVDWIADCIAQGHEPAEIRVSN